MTTLLTYFVIGIIPAVVFTVIYTIDKKTRKVGIIEYLDIHDETTLGVWLIITIILWPLELLALAFCVMLYLFFLLCTGIGRTLLWIISKLMK